MKDQALQAIMAAIEPMRNNALGNYIVPGLTSSLVGGGKHHGKVRVFDASRATRDVITPHSHRFDFTCLVLRGSVLNTIYRETILGAEQWCVSTIGQVCGANGVESYVHKRAEQPSLFNRDVTRYHAGETYSMTHEEIHSIEFERGAQVLFLEGPHLVDRSTMIEPWVNGKVVPTFKTEEWMFERLPEQHSPSHSEDSRG